MSPRYMEKLLQGVLYDDQDSFLCDKIYREQLIAELKAESMIQRNKVSMANQESVNKLLRTSKGKIKSIIEIIKAEQQNLGEELRLLVLTDYIKKEMLPAVGDPAKPVNELGVVPIFENIRRELAGLGDLRLGVLSGSVVIIPAAAKETLENLFAARQIKGSIKECGAPGFYLVTVSGTEHTASALLTELFGQGFIRILIGTKSLLGEGWDSPSINSLILASFVGSFMLSNQMRGRAIRTMKNTPGKVSNIWHLICMEPRALLQGRSAEDSEDYRNRNRAMGEESEDFVTLKRRFEGFLGVHYDEAVIENGLERLSFIQPPYSNNRINTINQSMLKLAADRPALRKRWDESLAVLEKMEIADEVGVNKSMIRPGMLAVNVLILTVLIVFIRLFSDYLPIDLILIIFLLYKFINLISPSRRNRSIGKAILRALQKGGHITDRNVDVKVESGIKKLESVLSFIYLKGGTLRDKTVFAETVEEFFAEVDNQRYLLRSSKKVSILCKYFCMPELFARRHEDGEIFLAEIKKVLGPYEMIYTRSAEGRKILLEARFRAFSNVNNILLRRKKVKRAFD